MKKSVKILVVGAISILFLSGMLGVSANGNGGAPGGLTPGFWKNLRQHGDYWIGYTPDEDTIGEVFELPEDFESLDVPLIDALKFGGGSDPLGMAKNLDHVGNCGLPISEVYPSLGIVKV